MTIKMAAAGEAKAQIVSFNLPSELQAGKYITGDFIIKNVGASTGSLLLALETTWDSRYYGAIVESLSVGASAKVVLEEGLIKMPNGDATIVIYGAHETVPEDADWAADGRYFKTDDTKQWTIKLTAAAPPPTEPKAQIVEAEFPEAAKPMSRVSGYFVIKNIGGEGDLRGRADSIASETAHLKTNETKKIEVSFTMPTKDVALKLRAESYKNGAWVEDDSKTVNILIEVPLVPIVLAAVALGGLIYASKRR